MLKRLLHKITPQFILPFYHYALARLAAFLYRHPSKELIVIGVTGTNGKSSTVQFIGQMLEQMGETVGWTTTASFKVADHEWVNAQKMTMLGRFQTQKLLRKMVSTGCRYAIVETSSQGIKQSRHIGIAYDLAVFTNLTPEHIEAHGGFEHYKNEKLKLFKVLAKGAEKVIGGREIKKRLIVNLDDEHASDFLDFDVEKKYGFGFEAKSLVPGLIPVVASAFDQKAQSMTFMVQDHQIKAPIIGKFNVYNILASITTCQALGFDWEQIKSAVKNLKSIPGRLEVIDEGQTFTVIVDYAYEPASLEAVYQALGVFDSKRLIQVTGSAGGGRDISRRAIIGKMVAEHADIVIVTNEDPYDDDPQEIVDMVADAAIEAGKIEGQELFRILDRQEAISFAMSKAQSGDLVLITGKGSEPVMAVANGQKVDWDDRKAARNALKHF